MILRPSDAVVAAVAANNVVTLRHDHDLFDSLKKVKSAATPATESKLSTAQKKAIHINHCLVLLKMNKVHVFLCISMQTTYTLARPIRQKNWCKPCKHRCRKAISRLYVSSIIDRMHSFGKKVIEAAIFSKDKKNPTKSEELLSAYVAAHPNDSDYVRMCLAQIAFAKDGADHIQLFTYFRAS